MLEIKEIKDSIVCNGHVLKVVSSYPSISPRRKNQKIQVHINIFRVSGDAKSKVSVIVNFDLSYSEQYSAEFSIRNGTRTAIDNSIRKGCGEIYDAICQILSLDQDDGGGEEEVTGQCLLDSDLQSSHVSAKYVLASRTLIISVKGISGTAFSAKTTLTVQNNQLNPYRLSNHPSSPLYPIHEMIQDDLCLGPRSPLRLMLSRVLPNTVVMSRDENEINWDNF